MPIIHTETIRNTLFLQKQNKRWCGTGAILQKIHIFEQLKYSLIGWILHALPFLFFFGFLGVGERVVHRYWEAYTIV